jgi:hypothetical protein
MPRPFTAAALAAVLLPAGLAAGSPQDHDKGEPVPILRTWEGPFLVKELNVFPKEVQNTPVGYIADGKTLAAVWKLFRPDDKVPEVDFREQVIVFARNVKFVNKLQINKVLNKDGVISLLAKETLTATPVESKIYISFALISRSGVRTLRHGDVKLDLPPPPEK